MTSSQHGPYVLGDTHATMAGTAGVETRHPKCSSFRAGTTRVSNPVCSPGFRASASVVVQRAAFATGVPPDLYAFHHYTRHSTSPYRPQAVRSPTTLPG